MAEAIIGKLLGSNTSIQSAGVETASGLSATKEAVAVMKEMGLDISNHRSRDIDDLDLSSFTLVIAMTSWISEILVTLGVQPRRIERLEVCDPYGKGIEVYRSTARTIELSLRSLFGLNQSDEG